MILKAVTFRATPDDLANLTAIAVHLQASGQTFATKTADVQYALRVATEGPYKPALRTA